MTPRCVSEGVDRFIPMHIMNCWAGLVCLLTEPVSGRSPIKPICKASLPRSESMVSIARTTSTMSSASDTNITSTEIPPQDFSSDMRKALAAACGCKGRCDSHQC